MPGGLENIDRFSILEEDGILSDRGIVMQIFTQGSNDKVRPLYTHTYTHCGFYTHS